MWRPGCKQTTTSARKIEIGSRRSNRINRKDSPAVRCFPTTPDLSPRPQNPRRTVRHVNNWGHLHFGSERRCLLYQSRPVHTPEHNTATASTGSRTALAVSTVFDTECGLTRASRRLPKLQRTPSTKPHLHKHVAAGFGFFLKVRVLQRLLRR